MGATLSMPEAFEWPEPTRYEVIFTSMLFGWQWGFGFLTARNVWRFTSAMHSPRRSVFAWMVWLEWLICTTVALSFFFLICYKDSAKLMCFWAFLLVAIMWTLNTQIMLQIICNRLALVESDRDRARKIKWGTFYIWAFINVTVFIVWIPARMMVSKKWILANEIWDRIEKVIYLLLDLGLNIYFVKTVKERLVDCGMTKYNRLVTFNVRLICVSLLADVLLVALMSMPSPLVYMLFHCVCYTIKLNIELAIAKLILVIAQEPNTNIRISEPERSRYEDVMDPYSVRSLRSDTTKCSTWTDSEKDTESELGIGNFRCGNCRATGSVVRRKKDRGSRPPRSMFSSRDLESVDEIEVDVEYELRSEKVGDVYAGFGENGGGDSTEPGRMTPSRPSAVYQVEVNGTKAGEQGQYPKF